MVNGSVNNFVPNADSNGGLSSVQRNVVNNFVNNVVSNAGVKCQVQCNVGGQAGCSGRSLSMLCHAPLATELATTGLPGALSLVMPAVLHPFAKLAVSMVCRAFVDALPQRLHIFTDGSAPLGKQQDRSQLGWSWLC